MHTPTLPTLPTIFVPIESAAIPFEGRIENHVAHISLSPRAEELAKDTSAEGILVDVTWGPDTPSTYTVEHRVKTVASKHIIHSGAIKKTGERTKLSTPDRTEGQIWRDQYPLRFDEAERKKSAIEDQYRFGQIDAMTRARGPAKVDREY